MKDLLETLAMAYQYPTPSSAEALEERVKRLPKGAARAGLERFIKAVLALDLCEQEELYTRTLDLTPLTAPYLAYAVYGEDYRRGSFMAAMNRELAANFVDAAGELPDHLIPVLRYLAQVTHKASMRDTHPLVASEPLPELLQLLGPALRQIHHTLKTLEPKNPYLALIEATQEAVAPILKNFQAARGAVKSEAPSSVQMEFGLGPKEVMR